jgi:hypothetical protein
MQTFMIGRSWLFRWPSEVDRATGQERIAVIDRMSDTYRR